MFEGRTRLKANATLDSLYTSILQEAFGADHPENDPRVRSVLGAVVLAANPLSPSAIAALLGFGYEEVLPLLLSLHSLLVLREDTDLPVRPFHKSFPDFIVDPDRCTNPRFRVCPPDHHAELLSGCLETMNRELERNMCKLPDGVVNSDVIDLRERVEEQIGQGLKYACRSWHKHVVGTIPASIIPILHRFLEEKFLFWLETLSILGAAREAVEALGVISKCEWTNVCCIPLLVYYRRLTRVRIRRNQLSTLSESARVSCLPSSRSSTCPHLIYTILPSSYCPQRRLYAGCINSMPLPLRGS